MSWRRVLTCVTHGQRDEDFNGLFFGGIARPVRDTALPDGRGLEASAGLRAMFEESSLQLIADFSSQVEAWNRWGETLAAAT
jgi:hypothetical protein